MSLFANKNFKLIIQLLLLLYEFKISLQPMEAYKAIIDIAKYDGR
jgi:hypothetical protein